jgi:hypothetical protein
MTNKPVTSCYINWILPGLAGDMKHVLSMCQACDWDLFRFVTLSRGGLVARAKAFWDAIVAVGGDHDNHEDSL